MILTNSETYGIILAALSLVFAVFHLLVIANIIPGTIVWGGRITDRRKLLVMELVSVGTILLTGAIGLIRAIQLGRDENIPVMMIFSWILFALFILNTLGNITAKTAFERIAFTPVTAVLAYLFFRLALGR